jgi:protein SDA1
LVGDDKKRAFQLHTFFDIQLAAFEVGMKQRVSITLKLPQLQNLIKRDPDSYKEEFLMQKKHFDSELEIFKLRPTKDSDRFTELVTFMSHIAVCYKEECADLPTSIMELMETHANVLHPDVRAKLLQALIMLRNKGVIDPLVLLKLSFKLFSVTDKTLRSSLVEYIFNDIKTINHEKKNDKLNRSVQAFLFGVIEEDTTVTARKTVEILCELYRRKVWTDARTVNMIGKACLSPSTRVSVAAINFFLGIETKMHEDEDEEKATEKAPQEIDYHAHSKKTKKRQRHVQKQVEQNAKLRRENQKQTGANVPLFPAIQMLHDPQALAEKLFKKLRQSGERFEVKLLLMNFVSRLIGCHKLLLLGFYSFLQRYLTSHQQEITHILAYLIQACHDLVPPEDLVPVVKAIAYNFITERCTNESIAVGINSVREIFVRSPALLREPDMADFVQDLVMYGRKTHKSVMTAAHGMVNLVRELYPALLRKGDRGKHHNPAAQPAEYGQQHVADGIEGVELLDAYEKGEIEIDSDGKLKWTVVASGGFYFYF